MNLLAKPATRRAAMAAVPRLLLMGPPMFERPGRRPQSAWAYAKLPALLVLLAADGRDPVRREWLAAMLWPDRSVASLRRAVFDLRRDLGEALLDRPVLQANRSHLQLDGHVQTDLDVLERAWRSTRAAGGNPLDLPLATQALALWRGELAAGLVARDSDELDLWLSQSRARWHQRALAIAEAVVEHHLNVGETAAATAAARLALDRAPMAEAARALWWQCLTAQGQRALAESDMHSHREHLRRCGEDFGPALERAAADLSRPFAAPRPALFGQGDEALVQNLGDLLRRGGPFDGAPDLLSAAEERLSRVADGALSPTGLQLARLAFSLRLIVAPWLQPMSELAALLEAQLLRDLPLQQHLQLTWPLVTFHGWMGRGLRGEVLLRGVAHRLSSTTVRASVRVAFELAMALCHSCSTGDARISLRAARKGLQLVKQSDVRGYQTALRLIEANAALNLCDADAAQRAWVRVLRVDERLTVADLAHYHQIGACLRLQQGRPAEALAEAQGGQRLAEQLPMPMGVLACRMAGLAARLLMGEDSGLSAELQSCDGLARRIGSEGYLMNLQLLHAVVMQRCGRTESAATALAEAMMLARRHGVRRLPKLPPALVTEALSPALRAALPQRTDADFAATLT